MTGTAPYNDGSIGEIEWLTTLTDGELATILKIREDYYFDAKSETARRKAAAKEAAIEAGNPYAIGDVVRTARTVDGVEYEVVARNAKSVGVRRIGSSRRFGTDRIAIDRVILIRKAESA